MFGFRGCCKLERSQMHCRGYKKLVIAVLPITELDQGLEKGGARKQNLKDNDIHNLLNKVFRSKKGGIGT